MSRDDLAPASTRFDSACKYGVARTASMCVWSALLTCLLHGPVLSQDLAVVTKVFHQDKLLSRSLTLFHGGKAFDFVEEVGEVVIHEPAHRQFAILSLNGNTVATRVHYEELLHYQEAACSETRKYLEELQARSGPSHRNAIQALAFQLDPKFGEAFDPATGTLRLNSQFVNYVVKCAAVERAGVQQYLDWADWTARLNSVLHPQAAVTPAARIKLNQALRDHNRLPTQVELTVSIESATSLKAEHSFDWSLSSLDRDSITEWEKARNSENLRWVPLREYQRLLIAANNRRPN